MNSVLYSSNKDDWETPQDLYSFLDSLYHFELDPCCSELNHKCKYYFTKSDNGLSKSWKPYTSVFCNPPYGKEIYKWVEKAYIECNNGCSLIVLLLPARTDTKWFHEFIYNKHDIYFIKGRLKFVGSKYSAPFPSMIVVMKGDNFNEKKKIFE